jgi:hypothetical protein
MRSPGLVQWILVTPEDSVVMYQRPLLVGYHHQNVAMHKFKSRNHVSTQIQATLTVVQQPAEISAKEDHAEHHKHMLLASFMALYQYQSAWL